MGFLGALGAIGSAVGGAAKGIGSAAKSFGKSQLKGIKDEFNPNKQEDKQEDQQGGGIQTGGRQDSGPPQEVVETAPIQQMNQLPMYHDGGDVPKDQVAKLSEGERVLNPVEAHAYKSAAIGNAPDTPLGRIADRAHELYEQGKALHAPEDEEAAAFAQKQKAIDEATQMRPLNPNNPPPVAPVGGGTRINPNAQYGDRGQERRIDPLLRPLGPQLPVPKELQNMPSYQGGGDVPTDQTAQVHEDEHVLDPAKAAAYRQAEAEEKQGAPVGFGGPVYPNPNDAKVKSDTEPAGETEKPVGTKMDNSLSPSEPTKERPIPYRPAEEGSREPVMSEASVKAPLGQAAPPSAAMRPLGRPGALQVTPEAPKPKEEAAPDPMAIIQQDKLAAAQKGHAGLADLGLAMIHENAFAKPAYTGTAGEMKAEKQKEGKERYEQTVADLKEKMLHGATEQIRFQAEKDLAEYKRRTPLGGEESARPGTLGKIEHVLGRVGQAALLPTAPYLLPAIPGTQAALSAQAARGEQGVEQAQKEELTKAQTEKAKEKTPQENIQEGTEELRTATTDETKAAAQGKIDAGTAALEAGKPSAEKALTSRDLFNKEQEVAAETDPTKKAQKQAELDRMKESMASTIKPTAEEDNRAFDAVTTKMQLAGTKLDPVNPAKSIDSAAAAGQITAQEAAAAHGYLLRHQPAQTKIEVAGAEAQQKVAVKKAGTYYTYKDDEGVHLVTGDKLPEGADSTPVKDVAQFTTEARQGNIVQESLNKVTQDVYEHPEVFDNAAARAILATTLEQIDRKAAGILVAGTGGEIPLPSGIGNMINTYLQNKGLDEPTAKAVQKYIADYKNMKDKAIVQQMMMQGGKIGRSSAVALQAIIHQVPGGDTPNSETAKRQLKNIQDTQDDLMTKYPDKYQDFKKAEAYKPKEKGEAGAPPKGATDEVTDKSGKVIGHVIVENGKKKYVSNQ